MQPVSAQLHLQTHAQEAGPGACQEVVFGEPGTTGKNRSSCRYVTQGGAVCRMEQILVGVLFLRGLPLSGARVPIAARVTRGR